MVEEYIFEGNDLKYAIGMESPGFDMNEDDWEVQIRLGKKVLASFTRDNSVYDSEEGQYYICIDHDLLSAGTIDIVFIAHVPDEDFEDGIRDEVDKKRLMIIKKL